LHQRLAPVIGLLCLIAAPTALSADALDPPPNYYATATGLGTDLKQQLNAIIRNHTVISYSNRVVPLQTLHQDPANTNNLILVYSGYSVPKTEFPGGLADTEHLWPRSYGIDTSGPDNADLFNMRPCNASVNSSRGNKYYDNVGGTNPAHAQAPECRTDTQRWEPRPIEKGDLARAMFYMAVRYDGTDAFTTDLELVAGAPSGSNFANLTAILDWHYRDPIVAVEREQNHMIFIQYQHNRNPFVDRPEFVWSIWGAAPNDSQLYVGASPAPDGSSSLAVDLGAVIVGGPLPAAQPVTLSKVGTAPTTFESRAGGSAVSVPDGPRQAFIAGIQSREISIALAGSTAAAGPLAGSVTIDNTDLTSSADGRGAADADDTVTVSASVLDHAQPSFDADSDLPAFNIDFGTVPVGSGPLSQPFAVHNRVSTPGFSASLDLDSIDAAGDTSVLATDLAPFSNLPAGDGVAFLASFDPAVAGNYSAAYTLALSDENLPGAAPVASLVLTLTAAAVPKCVPADADCNGVVDPDDAPVIAGLLLAINAPCSPCAADANEDGILDGHDVQAFVEALAFTP